LNIFLIHDVFLIDQCFHRSSVDWMRPSRSCVITPEEAITLDGLFWERVRRNPHQIAYEDFNVEHKNWRQYTWEHMGYEVRRWQKALEGEGLKPGDRVALMLRNSPQWVLCDQAALGLGLVVVPLYMGDRADNVAYVLKDCACRMLFLTDLPAWQSLDSVRESLSDLQKIITIEPLPPSFSPKEARVTDLSAWLPQTPRSQGARSNEGHALATLIYTSGTTGRPKGVMLSHRNILTNAAAGLATLEVGPEDVFLSFLPLSHAFERTCGYYLTMMGGVKVAYARSIAHLLDDLKACRPTILICVPRFYERIRSSIRARLDSAPFFKRWLFEWTVKVGWEWFEWQQKRGPWRMGFITLPGLRRWVSRPVLSRFGGRIRAVVSGGAALPEAVSRFFIGIGLPMIQGYGLTETSPMVCANTSHNNIPESVGQVLEGVEVKIGANQALLIKGPNVMIGYWNNEAATRAMVDEEGWLHSGDRARIGASGHVYITGRIKEIIVLSNGEKMPPGDMEQAILGDPLFDQVMIVGEAKPYLCALVVLNSSEWTRLLNERRWSSGMLPASMSLEAQRFVLQRISAQLKAFPSYAQIRQLIVCPEAWTVENDLLTPTLKIKRQNVSALFATQIEALYGNR
jgi:long-chain acyl-CoA synthetase